MLTLYNKFTPIPCPAASVLLFIARRNILLDELPKYSANLQNKSKASGQIAGQIRGILTLRRRIKSHLLFAGIIRSSPFSPR